MSLKLPQLWPMKERKRGQGSGHEKNEEMKETEENKLIIFSQWLFLLDIATSAPLEGLLVVGAGALLSPFSTYPTNTFSSLPCHTPPHLC